MKAVVTGGAGFIGSHMVELLLEEDHTVVAVDDMSNGHEEHVDLFAERPGYSFQRSDLAMPFDDRCFEGADWVFHMAALADIVPSIEHPARYFHANATATLNVLEAARKHGVRKLVYSASSSCYGIPDKFPTPETTDIRPEYPYALMKHLGEELVMHWGQVYKLPVISLRYFNVFGTRARNNGTYGAVFKVFLSQRLQSLPLTIVGDGEQTRDFTYVSDVVCANLMAAESDLVQEIMNVGTGNPQSVNYLAQLIGGETTHIPKRPGEPDSTHADCRRIRELLGWEPQVSFEDGVQIMLDDIEYWRDAPAFTVEGIAKATRVWHEQLGGSNE